MRHVTSPASSRLVINHSHSRMTNDLMTNDLLILRSCQCGIGHNLHDQAADMVMIIGEGLPQVHEFPRAEGAERLLDEVLEEPLDEGLVHLGAAGQEGCQLADAAEGDALAAARQVRAGCVNRLSLVLVLITA